MNLTDSILLLTRPEPAAGRFRAQAETALGRFARVILSPVLRIEPLGIGLPDAQGEALVFTSANAISALPAAAITGRTAWCVGAATAAAAQAAGARVQGVAPDAAGLIAMLLRAPPTGGILHVAGRHRRGALCETLRAQGVPAQVLEVYDQVAVPLAPGAREALAGRSEIVAPLFSPRSAALFSRAAEARRARVHVVAISPATLRDWTPRPGEQAVSAVQPDADGMIRALGSLFDAAGFA